MGDKWIRRRASLGLGLLLVVASFALPRGARAADCELVNWPSEVAISVWVLQTSTSLIYPVSPPGELYTLGNDLDCFLLGWDPYLSFEQAPMDLNLGFGPAMSVPGVPGLIAALFALSWHELDPFEIPFSACGLLLPTFPCEAVGAFAMVGVDVDDMTLLIDDASHILTIIPF